MVEDRTGIARMSSPQSARGLDQRHILPAFNCAMNAP